MTKITKQEKQLIHGLAKALYHRDCDIKAFIEEFDLAFTNLLYDDYKDDIENSEEWNIEKIAIELAGKMGKFEVTNHSKTQTQPVNLNPNYITKLEVKND